MKATLYFGTGFDSVNIPASKQVLMEAASQIREFDALDIISPYFQTNIRVKAKAETLEGYDYLSLDDRVYYSIMNVVPLSGDTANITVVMDTYLTYYSADNNSGALAFIGGSVVRSTAPFNQLFNIDEYVGSDPYFSYSECTDKTLSIIDLYEDPGVYDGTVIYASSYSDDLSGSGIEDNVQPDVKYNMLAKPREDVTMIQVGSRSYIYPGVTLYSGNNIFNTAKTLYGLGIDNVIDQAYVIPSKAHEIVSKKGQAITQIKGVTSTTSVHIYPDPAGSLREDIGALIFKSFGTITLIAVGNGNTASYSGSDIYLQGNAQRDFLVSTVTDPSPGGAPYFKPDLINDPFGGSPMKGDPLGEMYGGVKGASWQNAPISFGSKGYQADLMRLSNNLIAFDKHTTATDYYQGRSFDISTLSSLGNLTGSVAGNIPAYRANENVYNTSTANLATLRDKVKPYKPYEPSMSSAIAFESSLMSSTIGFGVSAVTNSLAELNTTHYYNSIRNAERTREVEQFNIEHIVRTTDLKFPVTDTSQNITGNGCAIITEMPSLHDRNRFLEIVQQFGVAVPGYKKMSDALLDRVGNEPFVYIQAKGVSFSSIVPKRVKNDLSSMFESGVRIWYEKPSPDAYTRMYKEEA